MANIRSAQKKMRQDKKKQQQNRAYKLKYKKALSQVYKKKSAKLISTTVSLIDKAVKKGVIHKNKAARLKSKLAKAK